ncbi:MAG: insulinase family protein, partial [Elioraea sp.]|nr:insulinase family protein [Elioraea sp.]
MIAPRTEADGQAGWSVPVQVVRSASGLEAWLIEDHSVPVLSVAFAFAGGAALDPPGQEGRATLLAALLTQGAGPHDTAAFASLLRERGVSLSF